ncbi:MAG: hypothetical protein AAB682_01885, partial [Patescibacteria group bacterium]
MTHSIKRVLLFVAIFLLSANVASRLLTPGPFDAPTPLANAADQTELHGWIWSDNVGWFSLNSADCDKNKNGKQDTDDITYGCGGQDAQNRETKPLGNYRVVFDNTAKAFSGY